MANVIVAGCHGGAGTTTVSRLLSPVARPLDAGRRIQNPGPTPLLLVARENYDGVMAATECLNYTSHIRALPLALVVVADSRLPAPKSASLRFRMLEPRLRAGVLRFPYVPRWRYEGFNPEVELPTKAQAALNELHQLLLADWARR